MVSSELIMTVPSTATRPRNVLTPAATPHKNEGKRVPMLGNFSKNPLTIGGGGSLEGDFVNS